MFHDRDVLPGCVSFDENRGRDGGDVCIPAYLE